MTHRAFLSINGVLAGDDSWKALYENKSRPHVLPVSRAGIVSGLGLRVPDTDEMGGFPSQLPEHLSDSSTSSGTSSYTNWVQENRRSQAQATSPPSATDNHTNDENRGLFMKTAQEARTTSSSKPSRVSSEKSGDPNEQGQTIER